MNGIDNFNNDTNNFNNNNNDENNSNIKNNTDSKVNGTLLPPTKKKTLFILGDTKVFY